MLLPLVVALVGCADPDPDALLRRHDLDGAAAAWAARHGGQRLDVDHAAAEALATRASTDPTITAATVADAMEAVRLLDANPLGAKDVDSPFPSMSALCGAVERAFPGPWLVAVGRPEVRTDKDPYSAGAALPWTGGRVAGWARTDLAAFGARIDADPPARKGVLAIRTGAGDFWVLLRRDPDGWWVLGASDLDAARRLLGAIPAGASAAPVVGGPRSP